jgi:16S rRNA (guanine527-N7)-methyltransferase
VTEDEALAWLRDVLDVSRETLEKLDAFRARVIAENQRQNLVSAGSIAHFWARHIVDSAQLLTFVGSREGAKARSGADEAALDHSDAHKTASESFASSRLGANQYIWLDLGTGAGFPGIVVAILRNAPIILVESRRKRSDFLTESAEMFGLANVTVHAGRLETMTPVPVSVISARAFAPLPRLLDLAHSFSTEKTRWVLPKGRSAREELESVGRTWQGVFHVKQSVTDPEAAIIVAEGVRRAGKR